MDRSVDFYTQALGFKLVKDITFPKSTYSKLAPITDSKVRLVTLQLGTNMLS